MKKFEFLQSAEAAGFKVDGNRVFVKNDLGVHLRDVLKAKMFNSYATGKFTQYSRTGDNFTVSMKIIDPIFATVDLKK
jgi:hypothetical protein